VSEYVLRGKDVDLRLQYAPDGQLAVAGDAGGAKPLRILRREAGGLVVALWGDRVVSGIVSTVATNTGEACDVQPAGAAPLRGLTLKPAAIDAMEQAVAAAGGSNGPLAITSPIPGLIKAVKVKAGDIVTEGQTVVVLEAMKMENEIPAPRAGTVQSVDAQPGQPVGAGVLLLKLLPG